jgi:glycosyltransferase involved in cell wall biosynthesis
MRGRAIALAGSRDGVPYNGPVTLSVCVPAFNESRVLARTLAAIRDAADAFGERGWTTELIVCDNNSTDATAAIAQAAGATVVFEPVNQIARARNTAARAATGDWLLFIDADSEPSRALLDDVADAIGSGQVLAGGSTAVMDDTRLFTRVLLGAWNQTSRLTRWAAGSFIFVEASAFREIGGFNQALYASEEIDLSRRLKRLARARGLSMRILHRHPLLTSARKLRLYSWREAAVFMLRTAMSGGRTLTRRDECFVWYDGRR